MSLWEDFQVVGAADAMLWIGREVEKLRYFFEVQAGLERTVFFHHKGDDGSDNGELQPPLTLSFDWRPIQRYLDPDVLLILGSDGEVAHPVYAIVPSQRAIVELDVHAAAEIPQASPEYLLARYLREVEVLIPTVPADRQGEVFKHFRALVRLIKPA